ncbi:GNAT family N-acetyltransferase [Roseospira visakhapatnamensis]|uniref:N-acetyltransferase domain-containing protein n=1 Tax=Roseospira visakhapatnamensis TaxID=390880 RepID=A0A7W6W9U3_9PROT|nr:GNAT family N-acetyltransferase [Roseospira visakhapatnamensis]MBB4265806.1 hypothetical protein [Roseospira visakhapatnamensis]
MPLTPCDLTSADLDRMLVLNNAAVPKVNDLSGPALERLMEWASVVSGARGEDGTLLGFVLALPPGLPYESENYRWVCGRRETFLYVDRVVVASDARGRGVGRALYRTVMRAAAVHHRRDARVICEVNERPPNPGSMAFHKALGFRPIGRVDYGTGAKAVRFLECRHA